MNFAEWIEQNVKTPDGTSLELEPWQVEFVEAIDRGERVFTFTPPRRSGIEYIARLLTEYRESQPLRGILAEYVAEPPPDSVSLDNLLAAFRFYIENH